MEDYPGSMIGLLMDHQSWQWVLTHSQSSSVFVRGDFSCWKEPFRGTHSWVGCFKCSQETVPSDPFPIWMLHPTHSELLKGTKRGKFSYKEGAWALTTVPSCVLKCSRDQAKPWLRITKPFPEAGGVQVLRRVRGSTPCSLGTARGHQEQRQIYFSPAPVPLQPPARIIIPQELVPISIPPSPECPVQPHSPQGLTGSTGQVLLPSDGKLGFKKRQFRVMVPSRAQDFLGIYPASPVSHPFISKPHSTAYSHG